MFFTFSDEKRPLSGGLEGFFFFAEAKIRQLRSESKYRLTSVCIRAGTAVSLIGA